MHDAFKAAAICEFTDLPERLSVVKKYETNLEFKQQKIISVVLFFGMCYVYSCTLIFIESYYEIASVDQVVLIKPR